MRSRWDMRSVGAEPIRMALALLVMMVVASICPFAMQPGTKRSVERPPISLKSAVPEVFGDWRAVRDTRVQIVDPRTKKLLDHLYSEVLTRTYVDSHGYRIMLSIAYGSDQRGGLQVHKPEVCYPAQGFIVRANDAGALVTRYGRIPVRRLYATLNLRQESITYWVTVGDKAVGGKTQKRLVELLIGLAGRIPDGLLFRISSIDENLPRAYAVQDQFANQLLESVSPATRLRLSGLR